MSAWLWIVIAFLCVLFGIPLLDRIFNGPLSQGGGSVMKIMNRFFKKKSNKKN